MSPAQLYLGLRSPSLTIIVIGARASWHARAQEKAKTDLSLGFTTGAGVVFVSIFLTSLGLCSNMFYKCMPHQNRLRNAWALQREAYLATASVLGLSETGPPAAKPRGDQERPTPWLRGDQWPTRRKQTKEQQPWSDVSTTAEESEVQAVNVHPPLRLAPSRHLVPLAVDGQTAVLISEILS